MTSDNVADFVPLLNFEDDYEILSVYPFSIRRKNNHYKISECINDLGYVQVSLNQATYKKHVLIAKQFIPNYDPEHKTQVDHINHDKTDYHLSNLRWVTPSENQKNKTSHLGVVYEYVDEIPDDAIVVNKYNSHEFEFYYYSESTDKFYFYNGKQYKILYDNEKKGSGSLYVNMMNTNNKKIKIFYNKFKKLYDIPF